MRYLATSLVPPNSLIVIYILLTLARILLAFTSESILREHTLEIERILFPVPEHGLPVCHAEFVSALDVCCLFQEVTNAKTDRVTFAFIILVMRYVGMDLKAKPS